MNWQLRDIGKTITNNILPRILSAHTVSGDSTRLVSFFSRQCNDKLKSVISVNFRIWSKYVGLIPFSTDSHFTVKLVFDLC